MKESTEPKIDLAEIQKIQYKLKFSFQVQDLKSVSIKNNEGVALIEALIALPKLVEALQNLHAAYAWSKGDETSQQTTALDNAYLALKNLGLDSFIDKTQQQ